MRTAIQDWANPATIPAPAVRCNYCMATFPEDEISLDEGNKVCPQCGRAGYLMDTEEGS